MKTRKNKIEKILKLGLLCFSIYLLITSCASNKMSKSDKYELIKYKHKNGFSSSILINSFYDSESAKNNKYNPLSYININNVIIKENEIINGNMKPYHISVDSDKKYEILIYGIGLQPLKIKGLYVKQGDSIVIKAYLKEDNRSLH
ncbi:hypothetical protein [Tenacibaculum dicentrarchi]|uniref:hypothetical protein n=1 Tax=Tenacibaculum dicentrarchi TaxID=669041 RepID=UPI000C6008E8